MLNRTPRLAAALVSATLLASLAVSTVSAAAPIHGNGHGPGHGPELDRELAAVRAATQRFQDPTRPSRPATDCRRHPRPSTSASRRSTTPGRWASTSSTATCSTPRSMRCSPRRSSTRRTRLASSTWSPSNTSCSRRPGSPSTAPRRCRRCSTRCSCRPASPTASTLPGLLAPSVAVSGQSGRAVRAVQPERVLRRGCRGRRCGSTGRLDVSACIRLLDRSVPFGDDPAGLTRNTRTTPSLPSVSSS